MAQNALPAYPGRSSGDGTDSIVDIAIVRVPRRATMNCTIEQVLSGDYLVLMVELGVDDLFKRVRARLHGVDTPDAYRQTRRSPAGRIRDEVAALARSGSATIELHHTYHRKWIVTLYVKTDKCVTNVNRMLADRGYVYSAGDVSDGLVSQDVKSTSQTRQPHKIIPCG